MNKQTEAPQIYTILTINPGSTSTKLALYKNTELTAQKTVRHTPAEFAGLGAVTEQKDIRVAYLLEFLRENQVEKGQLSAVIGRGGLVKPIDSGTYLVNEKMLRDLSSGSAGHHASSLGGLMAAQVAAHYGVPAYIADPVVVDEMEPVAKISGLPGIERRSIFHALNTKSVTRQCAAELGLRYEDARFVVAHMGGGISVGAHRYGRVIDVNDALYGEGPFSPERSGSLPLRPVIEMCYSGNYTQEEMQALVSNQGGMLAYLGSNDLQQVEKMIKLGDEYAALIVDAMAYQVSKEIGSMVVALEGRLHAIVLTGGLAHSQRFTGAIKQRVDQIAPVLTYPGEDEMKALAEAALRVLGGQEQALKYE